MVEIKATITETEKGRYRAGYLKFSFPDATRQFAELLERYVQRELASLLAEDRLAAVESVLQERLKQESQNGELSYRRASELRTKVVAMTAEDLERRLRWLANTASGYREASCTVSFERTLRLPDDGETYPLPPGMGLFPLRHVDDYSQAVPESWRQRGGVMLPIHQAEALWLDFESPYDWPIALKVGAGKVNAISGQPWASGLPIHPQGYVVIPGQPWLDGYCIALGQVRQFVAAKLGDGYTVEEQLTGEGQFGGIQLEALPLKAEALFDAEALPSLPSGLTTVVRAVLEEMERPCILSSPPVGDAAMGLGAGARIKQDINEDTWDSEDWNVAQSSRCFVHLCHADQWQQVTGEAPPQKPPTAADYSKHGLPWFDYYQDKLLPLSGKSALSKLKPVSKIADEKGDEGMAEDDPPVVTNVKPVGPTAPLKPATDGADDIEVDPPSQPKSSGHEQVSQQDDFLFVMGREFLEHNKLDEALESFRRISSQSPLATEAAVKSVVILMIHRGCDDAVAYGRRMLETLPHPSFRLVHEVTRALNVGERSAEALSLSLKWLPAAETPEDFWIHSHIACYAAACQRWLLSLEHLHKHVTGSQDERRWDFFMDYDLQPLWEHLATAKITTEEARLVRTGFTREVLTSQEALKFEGTLCIEWLGHLPVEFAECFAPDIWTAALRLKPETADELRSRIAEWYTNTKAANLRIFIMARDTARSHTLIGGIASRTEFSSENSEAVQHRIEEIDAFLMIAGADESLVTTEIIDALIERTALVADAKVIKMLSQTGRIASDASTPAEILKLDEFLRSAGEDQSLFTIEIAEKLIRRCEIAADIRFAKLVGMASTDLRQCAAVESRIREVDATLWTAGEDESLVVTEVIDALIERAGLAVDRRTARAPNVDVLSQGSEQARGPEPVAGPRSQPTSGKNCTEACPPPQDGHDRRTNPRMATVAIVTALVTAGILLLFCYLFSAQPFRGCTPLEKGKCTACTNCSSCRHCKGGGKCTLCATTAQAVNPFRHLPSDNRLQSCWLTNKLQNNGGKGKLTIKNSWSGDAVVKLISGDGALVAAFYVREDTDFTFEPIPDGSYDVLYCAGYNWDANGRTFRRRRQAARFSSKISFSTWSEPQGNAILTHMDTPILILQSASLSGILNEPKASDISVEEFDRHSF